MDDDSQPVPLFPDDDVVDNDEDLFAMPSAVCNVSSLLIVACESLSGRGCPVRTNTALAARSSPAAPAHSMKFHPGSLMLP